MGFGQRMRIGMAAGCKHLAKVKFSYGLGSNVIVAQIQMALKIL